jgi:hypothetical protein
MKVLRIFGVVIGGLLVVLALVFWLAPDPNAPKFVALTQQPTGHYIQTSWDWGGAIPVRDGKMWVYATSSTTNQRCFLYDLDSGLVKGELLRGSPVFGNAEGTKLLCHGYGLGNSLRRRLTAWLQTVQSARGLVKKLHNEETFWVLDLRDNSAMQVGHVFQNVGFGSSFVPSPSGRYGFNKPTANSDKPEFVVCDLESNRFFTVQLAGDLRGWWDEQHILVKEPQKDFVLFDVVTRQTNELFSVETISNLLTKLNLPGNAAELSTWSWWNGRDYNFIFAAAKERNWGRSFVLRAEHSNPELRPFSSDFKFQWLGRFDADGTHYVYPGESGPPGRGGDGGVYLRNLTNNTTVTLVAPDNGGQYSLPRFFGDGVIYSSNGLLWRVGLNGSNNVPLLNF